MDKVPSQEDLEQALAGLRPPSIPDQTFDTENSALHVIVGWKWQFAISIMAGLLTEPRYHANGVRLDWLQRLVISRSGGKRKPRRDELTKVLNSGLQKAGVTRLEDPNEDLFCELIVSEKGDFRLFGGHWESVGPYTQTLLDAFETLPDAPQKKTTLGAVYALLRLSDELARRAGVNRDSVSEGRPGAPMVLPSEDQLSRLAGRVRFTDHQLESLGISRDILAPFFLASESYSCISDRTIGDTPFELQPLIETNRGVLIASPPNISTAVRSLLILTASEGGMSRSFLKATCLQQERFTDDSLFWPIRRISLSPPGKFLMRRGMCQYQPGHFLHVIQVPVPFDGFPNAGFGSVHALTPEENQFIASEVEHFWHFVTEKSDCRSTTTVVLMSGWGCGHLLELPIEEAKVPPHWQFLVLSFADMSVLGVCPDSRFTDILRILRQLHRLEGRGFDFQNANGILNLFGAWRSSNGNLIPEHALEVEPPSTIVFPTNALLGPRLHAAHLRDVRALLLADGKFKVVERVNRGEEDSLRPVYASAADLADGRLCGAVVKGGRIWWVECEASEETDAEWLYQVWNAVLQWLDAVGQAIVNQFPGLFPIGARRVLLAVTQARRSGRVRQQQSDPALLHDAITIESDQLGANIKIESHWAAHLDDPKNVAEVKLIAAILRGLCCVASDVSRDLEFTAAIQHAVGSHDWRWLHAREAKNPEDQLAARGLTDAFREVPFSAHCLMKCGSTWDLRKGPNQREVEGKDACQALIKQYIDKFLDSLIADIRAFDRLTLCIMCGERYQAARAEQSRWRVTIRALRAIRGASADFHAFERQSEINSVQRAAKIVCEVAACEAPLENGRLPSLMELDEMFAKALLMFGNGQLYSSITTDLIPPLLKFSPGGDLLSERDVLSTLVKPGARWMNQRILDEAARAYVKRSSHNDQDKLPHWKDELERVIEAEYHCSSESFVDFQYLVLQLAGEKGTDTFGIRRSDLLRKLSQREEYAGIDLAGLVSRFTLASRQGWFDLTPNLQRTDFDLCRFDRPHSVINRPLVAIDASDDPTIVVVPTFVAEATMYAVSGLVDGSLNERYWESAEARRFAGARGKEEGDAFEETLTTKLKELKLEVFPRCKLSAVLNQKVPNEFGDIDALAISADRKRVWVIEAKKLRLCRTEAEAAARMSEYLGTTTIDRRGHEQPDKMLRHLRRVQYLRQHRERLRSRLRLPTAPDVNGLLVVDAPQPMNFHLSNDVVDGKSVPFDDLDTFPF